MNTYTPTTIESVSQMFDSMISEAKSNSDVTPAQYELLQRINNELYNAVHDTIEAFVFEKNALFPTTYSIVEGGVPREVGKKEFETIVRENNIKVKEV